MKKEKFVLRENHLDGTYSYYAGNGNWTNKKENAKVFKTTKDFDCVTLFDGELEFERV